MTTSIKKIRIEIMQRYAILALSLSLFVLVLSYAYLVNQTVLNVVERERVEEKITELTPEVGHLETVYVKETKNINLETAREMGFNEPKNKRFVSREPLSETVSLNKIE